MEIRIIVPQQQETLYFSAHELGRYLTKMSQGSSYAVLTTVTDEQKGAQGILLGVGGDLRIPQVANCELDDGYYIEMAGSSGVILGTNARSVLLAVYRYLTELGAAFLRPGSAGEILPCIELENAAVKLADKADYRHRGVCIEGNCSYTHVMEMIEYLPKIGMNSYFNQFFTPCTFFDKWYSHKNNSYMQPQPTTEPEIEAMVQSHICEIKKRGMLYHAVGHGWTCNPFGIHASGWDIKEYHVPPEIMELMAKVDGKRELWGGIPLNTNLCFSNPRAFNGIVDAIVDYCGEHSEVDYLHFWLADGMNNHCECEGCRNTTPADFYVQMLNAVDKKLTAVGLNTRIVFLIYVDLLWEPLQERLNNPARFTLMFAPITRTYTTPFCDGDITFGDELTPYVRNKLVMPKSVKENVARLRRWQQQFDGDSFDYDYHLIWDNHYDLGGYETARVLFADMKNLDKLGINGMMSCQVQRAFWPTGLAMYGMGTALWDKSQSFEEVARRYFARYFGTAAAEMEEYLRSLSDLFDPPYLRIEKGIINEACAKKFATIPHVVSSMLPKLHSHLQNSTTEFERVSWQALVIHAELALLVGQALLHKANGEQTAAEAKWADAADYIRRLEPIIHPLLDVEYFTNVYGRAISRQEVPVIY